MITIDKENKRIDIKADFETVLLVIDTQEYKVPLLAGEGCLTNIQEEMNEVKAYGLTELQIG